MDLQWKAVFIEYTFKNRLGMDIIGIFQALSREQKSTARIRDGKGTTVPAVAQAELTLEVRAPDLIGGLWIKDRMDAFDLAPSAPRLDQIVALEDERNC